MAITEILATLLLGLFLYAVRCRRPFTYGVLELLVAITIIFLTLYPFRDSSNFGDLDLWKSIRGGVGGAISVMVGIYVMVRGLDNIEKGLTEPRRKKWRKIFYGPLA